MPLIDVVFLLLTFFIYAMVVLVELKSSGVSLISVEGASHAVNEQRIILEIDGGGGVLIDGAAVAMDELDARLREIAGRADAPPVIVALQDVEASVDRGPILQDVQYRLGQAGVVNIEMANFNAGSGVSN